eukprot:gene19437-biopygen43787
MDAGGYDYWVVLDFEATCDEPKQLRPQEIIEFPTQACKIINPCPMLLVSAASRRVEATFHLYVRPVVHPRLSAFCPRPTGAGPRTWYEVGGLTAHQAT